MLASFKALLASRKTQQALFGAVTSLVAAYFAWPTLTPEGKGKAVLALIGSITVLAGVNVHGTAMEDAAEKSNPNTGAAPTTPGTVTTVSATETTVKPDPEKP